MSGTHTPGPWFQGHGADHPNWNGDSESEHMVWPDPHGVGRLIARAGVNFTGWIEQDAANARLMAAAPELLEALEGLLLIGSAHTVRAARAAIAKARGAA